MVASQTSFLLLRFTAFLLCVINHTMIGLTLFTVPANSLAEIHKALNWIFRRPLLYRKIVWEDCPYNNQIFFLFTLYIHKEIHVSGTSYSTTSYKFPPPQMYWYKSVP